MSPAPRRGGSRAAHRLALAAALVLITGVTLRLDAAMAVAFSLAAMEIDAHSG